MSAPQPFSPRRRAPASPPPQRIRPNTSPSRRPVGIQIPHAASSTCLNDAADSSAPAGPVDLTGESHVEHSIAAAVPDSNGTDSQFPTGIILPRHTPWAGNRVVTTAQPNICTPSINGGTTTLSYGNIQPGRRISQLAARRCVTGNRRPSNSGSIRSSNTAAVLFKVDGVRLSHLVSSARGSSLPHVAGHRCSGNGHFSYAGLRSPPSNSRIRTRSRPSDIAAQLAKSNRTPD